MEKPTVQSDNVALRADSLSVAMAVNVRGTIELRKNAEIQNQTDVKSVVVLEYGSSGTEVSCILNRIIYEQIDNRIVLEIPIRPPILNPDDNLLCDGFVVLESTGHIFTIPMINKKVRKIEANGGSSNEIVLQIGILPPKDNIPKMMVLNGTFAVRRSEGGTTDPPQDGNLVCDPPGTMYL